MPQQICIVTQCVTGTDKFYIDVNKKIYNIPGPDIFIYVINPKRTTGRGKNIRDTKTPQKMRCKLHQKILITK